MLWSFFNNFFFNYKVNTLGNYLIFGHIAVGVEYPDNPGWEIVFENPGIGNITIFNLGLFKITTENELFREGLSFTGFFNAKTSNYYKQIKADDGEILLPEGYDDYIQIDQNKLADVIMIKKGKEINSRPWKFNALGHSCLDYVAEVVGVSGYSYKREGILKEYIPTEMFIQNIDNDWITSNQYMSYFDYCYLTYKNNGGII